MNMSDYTKIDTYLETHLDESIAELSKLVAQPSVGAQNLGMQECATLVVGMLRQRGFTSEVMPTAGAPVVFGERKGHSDKTLLYYCHYDVQPPEPLELWETPPFEPSLRDGKLFGRGVGDDKGHLVARLFAVDALLSNLNELPCSVKFIIEGEEETSSVHLHDYVRNNLERLRADGCIWEFGGVDHTETPVQYLGLRWSGLLIVSRVLMNAFYFQGFMTKLSDLLPGMLKCWAFCLIQPTFIKSSMVSNHSSKT
jgi:acetylornithine deacetylase/succinyl-diaminopimelate desuccinylase-like protein